MKRISLILLFLAISVGQALAAVTDGITLTGCSQVWPGTYKCTIHWANDTGTDIGPTEIILQTASGVGIAGKITRWKTIPDATSVPTTGYIPHLLEDNDATNGLELCDNLAEARSTTANEGDFCLHGSAYGPPGTTGTVYPYVEGLTNANDDEGDIEIWIEVPYQ